MVHIIKLKSGIEIIGEASLIDNEKVVISDPFTINYMINADSDRPIVGLLRYMQFAEEYIATFQRIDILNLAKARKSMVDYYKDILTTYRNEIDDSVDVELSRVVEEMHVEEHESIEEVEYSTDMLTAMIEKTNNKIH